MSEKKISHDSQTMLEIFKYSDYLRGMVWDAEASVVGELDEMLGCPKTELVFRQIYTVTEGYSCGAVFKVINENNDYNGELIESAAEGVTGLKTYFEIKIGDFTFEKDLTENLKEYIKARNLHDDAESVGTLACIAMEVEYEILNEFKEAYYTR